MVLYAFGAKALQPLDAWSHSEGESKLTRGSVVLLKGAPLARKAKTLESPPRNGRKGASNRYGR